jgi:hydrogenase maturation protein HypF
MELEWLAERSAERGAYDFSIANPVEDGTSKAEALAELNWGPMVRAMIGEVARHENPEAMARKFHNTLAEMIARVVSSGVVNGDAGVPVVLTGGCFQNRLLTELTVARLEADGVKVYWHQRIPPNDGGISLGQVMAAARMLRAGNRDLKVQ